MIQATGRKAAMVVRSPESPDGLRAGSMAEQAFSQRALRPGQLKVSLAPDLFGSPLLPGMALAPDFVSVAQELELIENIDVSGLTPFRFRGWQGKRLTMSYGSSFDFVSGRMLIGAPVPHWLNDLKDRAAGFAGLPAKDLVHAQLTRYDPGAGINWHRDRAQYEHVIGVSLGAAAVMRLRCKIKDKFRRSDTLLPQRSIYVLSGDARHGWEHSIGTLTTTRWSITFRTLSLAGKAALRHTLLARQSTASERAQR